METSYSHNSKYSNVYQLINDGHSAEDASRMLGLPLRTVNHIQGIEE